jgi:SAM-dependent methyltransferase
VSDSLEFAPDLYRGTASDYDRFRLPYPPALIDHLLRLVNPSGSGWMLDLACGTGQLAFAMLDRFARVWAVDQEPDMVGLVHAKAARAGSARVEAIVSRAEELEAPAGAFELVAIGNAFHRLQRERVAQRLVGWLRPGGYVALVWSESPWRGEEEWQSAVGELIASWRIRTGAQARVPRGWDRVRRERPDEAVLADAGLEGVWTYRFPTPHDWTIEALTGFVYSTSALPRAVLGDQAPAFGRELRAAVEPHASDGKLRETIDSAYELARRPRTGGRTGRSS